MLVIVEAHTSSLMGIDKQFCINTLTIFVTREFIDES